MNDAPDAGAGRLAANVCSAVRLAWRAAPLWLVGYVAGTVVAGALPVAGVWLLKDVLDALAAGGGAWLTGAIGLAAAGFGTAVLPAITTYVHNQAGRRIGWHAQSDLYLATARQVGLARLEDPAFQDRLRMAQTAGRSVPAQVVDGLIAMTQSTITLVGLVGVLAVISPLAAAFAILGGVPALVAQIQLSRARAQLLWRISPVERRELFYMELQTSLAAAKELRLLGLFELFRMRMLGELAVADRERRRLDGRELRLQVGLSVLSAAVGGGGLVWAIISASRGGLTLGEVSAFVAGMTGLLAGMGTIVDQVAMVHHALLMYGHFRTVLEAEPDLALAADPVPVPALGRGIELRDVWFRYAPDQDWVLRGVDLVIPHGQATALVGLNGAGKSTLVKLLCRFYDPERGAILWDGVDLRKLSVVQLREHIGALFQDYMSYDLSAAENIGLGDVTGLDDDTRIRAAAGRAGVHQIVRSLPRGYGTLLSRLFAPEPGSVEEGSGTGVLLSGGQWQRLALARAFMRDRRDLLILDEPSSGLDAAAEYEIHRELRRHRAGATSVLISHRLGAIRDADRIVVLSGGRITEHGSHDALLTAGGEYARLFHMQAEGYQPGTVDARVVPG
ncbi:ABC transporter ATP-binding protein [Actinophytocola sp.]|uniref:ABC transporter ATP-binding protein n=1 Tax=Actinophytocola sp. TaxID=1872138 RepID=UPI003D6C3BCB